MCVCVCLLCVSNLFVYYKALCHELACIFDHYPNYYFENVFLSLSLSLCSHLSHSFSSLSKKKKEPRLT